MSNPSDFNDLHLLAGLSVVREQIEQAITHAHHQVPQSSEQVIVTSSSLIKSLLEQYIERYYLVEGKTDIWDTAEREIIKHRAFVQLIGKSYFKSWNDRKNIISKVDLDKALYDKAKNLFDNFVILEGTDTAWDIQKRKIWQVNHIKIAYPVQYHIWFNSQVRKQIPRENLIFDPQREYDDNPLYINLYQGLDIDTLKKDDGEPLTQEECFKKCQGIVSLIQHLCEYEKEAIQFLLKWLAYPLQNAGAKMASCVLMHGNVQGAGKSMLFGNIMKKIYGDYHATVGQQQLDSNYNDWIENKLFAVFEEIVDNKKKHNVMGMIKHLITGETIYISKKFISGWEMDNHLNSVFLSNNTQPLPIEEKDRRFLILNPSKALTGELHDKVLDEIKNDGISAFYSYLMQIDLKDFGEHSKPPMTKAKKNLIDYSRNSSDTFYHDWKNGDLKYPFCCCLPMDLYEAFKQWAKQTGEHIISQKRFAIEGYKHGIRSTERSERWKGRYSNGMNKIIMVKNPPEDNTFATWIGLQIEEFHDTLKGYNSEPPYPTA